MPHNKEKKFFLLCVGIIPTAFWMISALISGNALKDMWNFPSLFAWGIIAFYFFPRGWTSTKCQKFAKVMLGWSLVFALAYVGQCLISPSERFHSNCPKIVADLEKNYFEKTGKPLDYVGGNIWFSAFLPQSSGLCRASYWRNSWRKMSYRSWTVPTCMRSGWENRRFLLLISWSLC